MFSQVYAGGGIAPAGGILGKANRSPLPPSAFQLQASAEFIKVF